MGFNSGFKGLTGAKIMHKLPLIVGDIISR